MRSGGKGDVSGAGRDAGDFLCEPEVCGGGGVDGAEADCLAGAAAIGVVEGLQGGEEE